MRMTRRMLLCGASAYALAASAPALMLVAVEDPLSRIYEAVERSLQRYLDEIPGHPFEGGWSLLYAKWVNVLDIRAAVRKEIGELYSDPEVLESIAYFGLLDKDNELPLVVQHGIVDRFPIECMLLTRPVLDAIAACAPAHLR